MKPIPMLSVDLINQLAEDEPELDIRPDVNMETIMFRSGRMSLIRDLIYRKEHFENQKKDNEIKY